MKGIDHHRRQIADIDKAFIRLLRKRILMVEKAWEVKRALELPLVDKRQEAQVLRRARKWATYYSLSPSVVAQIFQGILREGKRLAKPATSPSLHPRRRGGPRPPRARKGGRVTK
jgi:chorismate mutase